VIQGFPSDADPGWWRVVDVTAPIQEPVTIAQAKNFARIEFSDDDAIVAGLISAAREYVETASGRTIAPRLRSVYFQGFLTSGGYFNRFIRSIGPNPWWLPTAQGIMQVRQPPLQGMTNIQYVDPNSGNYLEIYSSQIIVSTGTPGRVMPQYGAVWPLARPQIDAVIFTFVAGYGLTNPYVGSSGSPTAYYGGPPSQTIMIYGTPTGGTFTLTFNGDSTSSIAYNATAATVQTALQALGNIGSGNVICSGGPLPTIPIFVTWSGSMAQGVTYQPSISASPSLTGDAAATMYTSTPPALPWSASTAIMQIVADSYENREAAMEQQLKITPVAERMLMPIEWGRYV
jgi:Phage gp6-like head-tail connector protein